MRGGRGVFPVLPRFSFDSLVAVLSSGMLYHCLTRGLGKSLVFAVVVGLCLVTYTWSLQQSVSIVLIGVEIE